MGPMPGPFPGPPGEADYRDEYVEGDYFDAERGNMPYQYPPPGYNRGYNDEAFANGPPPLANPPGLHNAALGGMSLFPMPPPPMPEIVQGALAAAGEMPFPLPVKGSEEEDPNR